MEISYRGRLNECLPPNSVVETVPEVLWSRNPLQRREGVYAMCYGHAGLKTALEELMCRVLGDHLQAGYLAKLADDLYCRGNSPEELLANWTSVMLLLLLLIVV